MTSENQFSITIPRPSNSRPSVPEAMSQRRPDSATQSVPQAVSPGPWGVKAACWRACRKCRSEAPRRSRTPRTFRLAATVQSAFWI